MTLKPKPRIGGIRVDYLQAAVAALRYKAHNDAGHSQGSWAFDKEDTYDWEAAQKIEEAINAVLREHDRPQNAPSL